MDNENKFDKDNYGSMWLEQNAKVVRKGSFQLMGHKFYGMVVEKQNAQGETQHEMMMSLGLLHLNVDKMSDRSPDLSGKIRSPLWTKDDEGKLEFKNWKLGIWAKEAENGTPYSSLGFTELEDEDEKPFPKEEDGKPAF